MTRNNLKDQLSWLLANTSIVTPNAPSLPPAREPTARSSSPADETVFFTPTAGLSPVSRPNEPATTQLYPTLPGESSRPSALTIDKPVASTVGSLQSQRGARQGEPPAGNMGRLVSKPNSKRPNLTLHQEQLPSPASTATGASLSNDYPAFLAKNLAKNRITAQNAPPEPRPESVLPTPGPSFSTNRAVDVVDLTNGSGRTSSASMAVGRDTRLWREEFASRLEPVTPSEQNSTVFGSEKMVWREDYASRPGPVSPEEDSVMFGSDVVVWKEEAAWRPEPQSAKRGKKRKSDQISQPPLAASDDFTDIMDLLSDDENLQALVKQSPTRSPARAKLKTSPSKTLSSTAATTTTPLKKRTMLTDDIPSVKPPHLKTSPFKTPKKHVTRDKLEASATKLSAWSSGPDSVFGSDVEAVSKSQAKISAPTRSDERIIQDSDDEPMTPLAPRDLGSPIRRTDSPARRHHASQPNLHIDVQNTPSRTYTVISSQSVAVPYPPPASRQCKRSESQPNQSLNEADAGKPTDPAPSSQSNAHYSDERLSAMLQLFLRQPSIIEMKRIFLEEGLRQNRESFKKSLREGSLEPRERLRRDKEKLMRQQTALDILAKEYRSYEDLATKRDALIARIAEAYEHDLNTEDDESHLQELDVLLKNRQDVLRTYLLDAGIDDPAQYEDQGTHNIFICQTESVVQATQATRPAVPFSISRESSQIPSGTQVIMQTQVPSQINSHFQERGQNFAEVLPRRMARGELHSSTKTKHAGSATPTPNLASDGVDYEGGDVFETDDVLPESHLSGTTRTTYQFGAAKSRRTPGKQAQRHGYESDYSDGIDISELAQEIEFQQSSAKTRPSKTARPVLSETSGNLRTRVEKSVDKSRRSVTAAPVSSQQKKFPWYRDVKRALKDRFRMNGFRHNQLEAINATLAAKDAFILMPTGGGKSLCYQLPAVVTSGKTSGITVVVSPLLSLMQDQVEHLKALNIAAATFNGDTTPAAKREIMDALKQPYPEHYFQLLYVTPEMINRSELFLSGLDCLYSNKKLARLVIDEAHCVSQWGHDFRPDYKQLGNFRERFPRVPLMALTATATQNVIMDVKHNLGIDKCEQFTQSFNRPNLYYEVRRKEKDNTATIADLINSKYPGKTGIVYTLSKKSTETIADKLRGQGIAAHHYHAGVEPNEKVRIQRDWQRGMIKVVVATIAFGMGIDKPDVRFVIHQSVPKSLEGYYQETGRAGRDGQPSECYLYFAYGDVSQLRKLIADGDGNNEQRERQKNMLGMVTNFCDDQSECRRVAILRYFGETFTKAQCKATCDNCMSKDVFEQKDFTEYAVAVLGIVRAQERITLAQCTDYLVGKKKKTEFPNEVGDFHGMARHIPKHEIHRIIYRLLAEEALSEDNVINKASKMAVQYFRIGRGARSFLDGKRKLQLTTPVKSDGGHIGAAKVQRRLDVPAAPATRKEHAVQFTSTLVSSPARKSSSKRKGKAVANYDEDSDEDINMHSNGYSRDGFVVGDDEQSDDDFEAMPPPVVRRRRANPVGPPISHDVRLTEESLTDIQKDILESFFKDAQKLEEKIRVSNGFREPLFTQRQIREMGLRETVTLDQMRQIPGIKEAMVSRYGNKLLPLVQRYHQQCREIMGLSPEPRPVPHLGEIVDLVTSDDDEEGDEEDQRMEVMWSSDDDEDDDEGGETSGYFQPSVTETAFMEKFHRANQREASSSTTRRRSSGAGTGKGGKSSWRGGKGQYSSRRSSGSKFAGVKKKGTATKRGSSSQPSRGSGSSSTASRNKNGRSQGVGFDGIGLMDH